MTATVETTRPPASALADARLTAGGILRSEWVKLVTLRSTWWCLGVIVGLTAAAVLMGWRLAWRLNRLPPPVGVCNSTARRAGRLLWR